MFFAIISLLIFIAPYEWLGHLSLWQALHIPSPSIGLTRAYHLLLHGGFDAAWQRNKLIFIVVAIGIPLLIRDAAIIMKQRSSQESNAA